MDKPLTVGIPTYNRREKLIAQLRTLEAQGLTEHYQIVVNDNHGNYDVAAALDEAGFRPEFLGIITVNRRPYNVGMDLNIAFTQMECTTDWLWLLGDDDHTRPGSLQLLLDDTRRYPEVGFIKYHTHNASWPPLPFADAEYHDLAAALEAFGGNDFSFMSTSLYNMRLLRPYAGGLPQAAATLICDTYLPMMALKNGIPVRTSASETVDINEVVEAKSWTIRTVALHVCDYRYSDTLLLTKRELKAYRRAQRRWVPWLDQTLDSLPLPDLKWVCVKKFIIDYGLCLPTVKVVARAMLSDTVARFLFRIYRVLKHKLKTWRARRR